MTSQAVESEHRKTLRLDVRFNAGLREPGSSQRFEVEVIDLSMTGFRFETSFTLKSPYPCAHHARFSSSMRRCVSATIVVFRRSGARCAAVVCGAPTPCARPLLSTSSAGAQVPTQTFIFAWQVQAEKMDRGIQKKHRDPVAPVVGTRIPACHDSERSIAATHHSPCRRPRILANW